MSASVRTCWRLPAVLCLSSWLAALAAQQQPEAVPLPPPQSPPSPFRLVDVSLDILTAVGSSSERDGVLEWLQGGGHDPRKRGFTLQNVELSLAGSLDPYFDMAAHIIAFQDPLDGETMVELEEAYFATQRLPWGLDLEVGTFFTEFGRHNPHHPHDWTWQDQPVILTRVFGPDGMRGAGARVGWLVPGSAHARLHLGVQNASGEAMPSFLASDEFYDERPIGGRLFTDREVRSPADLVYLARAATRFHPRPGHDLELGASVLTGPNATGPDGDTWIYGVDLGWRVPLDAAAGTAWQWEAEFVERRFAADAQVDTAPVTPITLPAATLRDRGAYLQGKWGFAPGWGLGLRGEWVGGSGASHDGAGGFDRSSDPFRADRWRWSPLLSWEPVPDARIRLQYNYDDTDALADPVHSVWLGFEVRIGVHRSHGHEHHRH